MRPARVLIVDDDLDVQQSLGRLLRYHDIDYDMAVDAADGMKMLHRQAYNAVVIDLGLPDTSGWTLLKAIRIESPQPHVPCIAITAYHLSELAKQAAAAGFAAYFPKPLEVALFVHELKRTLSA